MNPEQNQTTEEIYEINVKEIAQVKKQIELVDLLIELLRKKKQYQTLLAEDTKPVEQANIHGKDEGHKAYFHK